MSFDYTIISKQKDVHKDTLTIAQKHFDNKFQYPISKAQEDIFLEVHERAQAIGKPIILDSGCGTGMSTDILANQYPDHLIIGIDKSIHRLSRNNNFNIDNNFMLVRANLIDFWLLAKKHNWQIDHNFLLYPNPWPKPQHFKRRFHGHPVLPTLLSLSKNIEIRSNWDIYLKEFSLAASLANPKVNSIEKYKTGIPMTLFESKYWLNNVCTYRLTINLNF